MYLFQKPQCRLMDFFILLHLLHIAALVGELDDSHYTPVNWPEDESRQSLVGRRKPTCHTRQGAVGHIQNYWVRFSCLHS